MRYAPAESGTTSVTCVEHLVLDAARVCEAAAIAAARHVGRGDEKTADQAAVDAMRRALNRIDMQGRVVIGEGERDEAPMLYIGEEVGTGKGTRIDIALDPLEGTTLCATGGANSLAVLAFSGAGGLLHAPDTYMEKIAVGADLPESVVGLDLSPGENMQRLAEASGRNIGDLVALILNRPRHDDLIREVRKTGARVRLIQDGDVAGVIATTRPETGIDIYMGIGGAPEGVLAAAALRCVGGHFQGRLAFRDHGERNRARAMGITDPDRIFSIGELASGDVVFCATGVTDGWLLRGVREEGARIITQSLVMSSSAVRVITTDHASHEGGS